MTNLVPTDLEKRLIKQVINENPSVIYLSENDWQELEETYKARGQGTPVKPLIWGVPIRKSMQNDND